jgi:hypothetical protein
MGFIFVNEFSYSTDQSGGRGREYFSSEKPDVVEAQQDARSKERYSK